jgi:hypothetical protein
MRVRGNRCETTSPSGGMVEAAYFSRSSRNFLILL